MATNTLGTSGADYTSINSWVSAVQGNGSIVSGGLLLQNVTLNTLSVGVSPTAADNVTGWAPGGGGFTTTLSATSGNSANTNASVQSNAFFFNKSNGAFWDYTAGSFSNPGCRIDVDKATVSFVQIQPNSSQSFGCIDVTSTASTFTLNSCILNQLRGGATGIELSQGGVAIIENNLITTNSYSPCVGSAPSHGSVHYYNNSFMNTFATIGSSNGTAPGNYAITEIHQQCVFPVQFRGQVHRRNDHWQQQWHHQCEL